MNRITENNWLQKERASSLNDVGPLSLFHVTYVLGRTAEYAATVTKGARLQIMGEIQTRSFVDRDRARKSVIEIRAHRNLR